MFATSDGKGPVVVQTGGIGVFMIEPDVEQAHRIAVGHDGHADIFLDRDLMPVFGDVIADKAQFYLVVFIGSAPP
ncbi:MAG: hypothetical protein EBT13_14170 [Rhodobacteraceae bacterium]|nr:hypothetical protein [Paracoccaceae bacterium]